MHSAMTSISTSFRPRVVTAGVPRRTPLVTNGLLCSFGIVFLFAVIYTSVETALQLFAGQLAVGKIEQHQMVIRAAGNELHAAAFL